MASNIQLSIDEAANAGHLQPNIWGEHTFWLRNRNNVCLCGAEVSSVQVNLFVFLPGARNTICPHQQQKHNNWCALSPTRSEATKPFKYGVLFNRVSIGGVSILRKYLA